MIGFCSPAVVGSVCLQRTGYIMIVRDLAPGLMNGLPAVRGAENGRAKLTEADIPTIRRRVASEPLSVIAADLGVSVTTIGNIANGRTWKHVKG